MDLKYQKMWQTSKETNNNKLTHLGGRVFLGCFKKIREIIFLKLVPYLLVIQATAVICLFYHVIPKGVRIKESQLYTRKVFLCIIFSGSYFSLILLNLITRRSFLTLPPGEVCGVVNKDLAKAH